jgi:hypothetical protein
VSQDFENEGLVVLLVEMVHLAQVTQVYLVETVLSGQVMQAH